MREGGVRPRLGSLTSKNWLKARHGLRLIRAICLARGDNDLHRHSQPLYGCKRKVEAKCVRAHVAVDDVGEGVGAYSPVIGSENIGGWSGGTNKVEGRERDIGGIDEALIATVREITPGAAVVVCGNADDFTIGKE